LTWLLSALLWTAARLEERALLLLGCILVSFTAFLLLLLERRGHRWLELAFGAFIAVEAAAAFVNFFQARWPPCGNIPTCYDSHESEQALSLVRACLPHAPT
jgi:hypothetical protein